MKHTRKDLLKELKGFEFLADGYLGKGQAAIAMDGMFAIASISNDWSYEKQGKGMFSFHVATTQFKGADGNKYTVTLNLTEKPSFNKDGTLAGDTIIDGIELSAGNDFIASFFFGSRKGGMEYSLLQKMSDFGAYDLVNEIGMNYQSVFSPGHYVGTNAGELIEGDSFSGMAFSDVLRGAGGDDILKGYLGNDRLFGGAGNDRVMGGSGADLLSGGRDDDSLWGNQGADTFRFKGGHGIDKIKDFEVGVDKIELIGASKSDMTKAVYYSSTGNYQFAFETDDGRTKFIIEGLDRSDLDLNNLDSFIDFVDIA